MGTSQPRRTRISGRFERGLPILPDRAWTVTVDIARAIEAVHGSAPDIAGKEIANPLAPLLAGALMLKHVNRDDLASRLRAAITQTLQVDNVRTVDLGGKVSTADFRALSSSV